MLAQIRSPSSYSRNSPPNETFRASGTQALTACSVKLSSLAVSCCLFVHLVIFPFNFCKLPWGQNMILVLSGLCVMIDIKQILIKILDWFIYFLPVFPKTMYSAQEQKTEIITFQSYIFVSPPPPSNLPNTSVYREKKENSQEGKEPPKYILTHFLLFTPSSSADKESLISPQAKYGAQESTGV